LSCAKAGQAPKEKKRWAGECCTAVAREIHYLGRAAACAAHLAAGGFLSDIEGMLAQTLWTEGNQAQFTGPGWTLAKRRYRDRLLDFLGPYIEVGPPFDEGPNWENPLEAMD
jgi:hypothetical protein